MTPRPTHTHDTRGTSKRSVESLVSVQLRNKVAIIYQYTAMPTTNYLYCFQNVFCSSAMCGYIVYNKNDG